MAYSNGYNLTTVLPALFGRLAWSAGSGLNSTNTTTKSGRRFDDGSFHAAVSVDNIKSVVPSAANWDTYFTDKQNSVIARCLQQVFTEPEFREQHFAYKPYDELLDYEINSGRAVGYRILIAHAFDVGYKINSLQLYFDSAGTFNVYLFKAGDKTALKTKSVTTVANKKVNISLENDDWILNYQEADRYYIVYFQNDLAANKAIKENVCWNKASHFYAEPFSTSTVGSDFDRSAMTFNSEPFGLNFHISVFTDFTQNILNQPYLFDEMIGLAMAYQVLEEIIYSTQSDKTERILKEQVQSFGLQYDLKGQAPITDGPKTKGLQQRIEGEIARIKKAFYPKPKAFAKNVC